MNVCLIELKIGGWIFQVLGTDELNAYLNKYHLVLDPQLDALVGRYVLILLFFNFATCMVLLKSKKFFSCFPTHSHFSNFLLSLFSFFLSFFFFCNKKIAAVRSMTLTYGIFVSFLTPNRHSRKPWSKFINADNQHLVFPEVIFVDTILTCAGSSISFLVSIIISCSPL